MNNDIVCFSHLRWDFVYQRPQHLMSRLARNHRVFFMEEPFFDLDGNVPYFDVYKDPECNVTILTPHLSSVLNEREMIVVQKNILNDILRQQAIHDYILWYYTPMAYSFSDDLKPVYTVYDCMDELSAFLFAPPALKRNELMLLQAADIVFTGGFSLYMAKKGLHRNIHSFPSSIDKDHFHSARRILNDPEDQRNIPYPRIGFYGVIDERLNLGVLDELSAQRPDWQFIMIGPVVKIDAATLPRRANIHYLGPKRYAELPAYLSGWDIAMMPFALNASTKFISPTKTPEYLAGGKPVISPSIADVIKPYGEAGLVSIADTAEQFIAAAEKIFHQGVPPGWLGKVDHFLSGISWDKTVLEMEALIEKGIREPISLSQRKTKLYV